MSSYGYILGMKSVALLNPILNRWPLFALLSSAAVLGGAHAFETFGNMPPCALCLYQRDAYWGALSVAILALIAAKIRPGAAGARAFALLLALAFMAGASIAGFHVGVEYKWWPGLAECAAGGKYAPSGDLLGSLSKTMDVPACDKVAWSMLGVSMAGWNMFISLGLAGISVLAIAFPIGFKDKAHD